MVQLGDLLQSVETDLLLPVDLVLTLPTLLYHDLLLLDLLSSLSLPLLPFPVHPLLCDTLPLHHFVLASLHPGLEFLQGIEGSLHLFPTLNEAVRLLTDSFQLLGHLLSLVDVCLHLLLALKVGNAQFLNGFLELPGCLNGLIDTRLLLLHALFHERDLLGKVFDLLV